MKKTLALILAICMVFALAACGETAAPAATEAAGDTAAAEETAAAAVEWPTENVSIIVGFGAGGDTDLAGRVIADALAKKTGVSVIVENLTGGTGVVARTELLAREDGAYTLIFDQPGSPITQVLMGNTTYDLDGAGTPVAVVGVSALALCVAKDNARGIKTMDDFIAYAKENPGVLTYAIPGQFTSAHLAALNAFSALGIEVSSVPTDGTATCVTEALGGHVDAMCVPYSGAAQYVESGDMILLGLSAASDFAPDAPLLTDYEGVSEYQTWYSIWAGAGLDDATAEYVNQVIGELLTDEEVVKSLKDLGIQIEFQDYATTKATVKTYQGVIKDALVAGGALAG